MMRPRLLLPVLLLASTACNRPPVGCFEIATRDNVPFVQRGDRQLCMDIAMPTDAPAPRPAVLWFHGGGWIAGHRSELRQMTLFLASMGYVSATASYRLCNGDTHYPAPVQDALAALKFLRSHAAEYGIDAQRIAVGGESAGGQLALIVGLVRDHSVFKDDSLPGVSSQVSAIIDIYGPTNLGPGYDRSMWLVRHMFQCYLGGPPSTCPERYKEASPITHVRPDAPPVLIVHGDRDTVVGYDHATALHNALRAAGASSRLTCVPGAEHGWGYDFSGNTCMRTLPVIIDFLAENLRCRAAS